MAVNCWACCNITVAEVGAIATELKASGATLNGLLVPENEPLLKLSAATSAALVTRTVPVQAPFEKSVVLVGVIVPAE